jgi:predicted HTH transcriptional regulator
MPKENERDVQMTPEYVKNKIKVRFVSSIEEVLVAALLEGHDYPSTDDASNVSASAAPIPISKLINLGEGLTTEFKSTLRVNLHTGQNDPRIEREVLKSMAGFLNSDGGTLVVGVDDEGKPLGLRADNFSNEDKMNLHLVNLIRDRLGPQNMLFIHFRFDDYDSKRVLIVDCKKSRSPVYVRDGSMEHFYIRIGAATTELSGSQLQQYIKHRFR